MHAFLASSANICSNLHWFWSFIFCKSFIHSGHIFQISHTFMCGFSVPTARRQVFNFLIFPFVSLIVCVVCVSMRFRDGVFARVMRCCGTLTCAQCGRTALFWAACNGHADCARLLLDAGAAKNAADKVRRVGPPRLRVGAYACLRLAIFCRNMPFHLWFFMIKSAAWKECDSRGFRGFFCFFRYCLSCIAVLVCVVLQLKLHFPSFDCAAC